MWSASASRALVVVVVAAVAAGGCGPRALDVTLTIDATGCTLSVPPGGSLLYQVEANGTIVDGGPGSFCGGCLAVDSAITTSDQLIAFLRTHAPSCGGVHPNSTLAVRVTGWSAGGCPAANAALFCADAPSVLTPDGTSNTTLTLKLVCKPACSAVCVPTTCAAQSLNCGSISDGCNMVLECGTCKPPQRCGATMPNVCGR
jgi:hypothetical protein